MVDGYLQKAQMADKELSTEEALALISAPREPVVTTAPLGSQLLESFGRGSYGSTVGLLDALTSAKTYAPLVNPQTYKDIGQYVYDQPLQAIESGARTIGRGSTQTAAALASAPYGAALGMWAGGLKGALAGGMATGATGGAAGGLLWDKIMQSAGFDPATTSEQDINKLAEETGALLSGEAFTRGAGRALKSASNVLIPGVAQTEKQVAAQIAAGNELKAQGVNESDLYNAIAKREKLSEVNPAAKNLSTAELTGNQNLAILEDQLQKQPATAITTANAKTLATNEADDLIGKIADFSGVNLATRGKSIQSQFRSKRRAALDEASKPFTGPLKDIEVRVGGLTKNVDDALAPWMQEGKAPLNKEVSSIVDELKTIAEPTPITKTQVSGAIPEYGVSGTKTTTEIGTTLPSTTVGSLQNLRSRALKVARTSKLRDVKAQALDVADAITKQIEFGLDAESVFKQTPGLKAEWQNGNQQYRDTMELYYRSPLAKAMNKVNGEDVINALKKSEAIKNFQDVFGNITPEVVSGPQRSLLSSVLKKYKTLKTPESKVRFLEDNRKLFEGTGVWPSMQNVIDYHQSTIGTKALVPSGARLESLPLSQAAQKGISGTPYVPNRTGPITNLILGTSTLGGIPAVMNKMAKSKAAKLTEKAGLIGQELSKSINPDYAQKLVSLANIADQQAKFKRGYSPYAVLSSALNAARPSEEQVQTPINQSQELSTEEALALLGQ